MKRTISKYDFERAFHDCGRGDQFSYEALELLFDFLEEMEQDTGEEWELDVISLCCDFSEDDWGEIADNYNIDVNSASGNLEDVVIDYLQDNTLFVGKTSGTLVYQAF